MKAKLLVSTAFLAASVSLSAQKSATITVHADQGKEIIPKEIYGQFAEHLGSCIYGGLWVGENSDIPNIKGYRTDVFNALKDLSVPVLRWPGGCFADEYHWMDGIGPKENRPKMVNNNWGGTIEDNSFGTHEFLNLCEMLGCEPYVSGNVGSGTVEELAKWVEYMTSDGDSPMANLRRKNGRDKAWKLKYLGVGNESWGCGGSMRPEYYADLYRRYSTYCRNYDGNRLFKIASGASDYDYKWTDVLMNRVGHRMDGLSLHYYTVTGWSGSKGSATQFNKDDYYWTMGKCLEVEDVLKKHCTIMDKYDKDKKIALLLDEWGTWWDEEPGTIKGHLYQQNTLRDAFVASLSLDVFHKYTDRLKMANIAQMVNVLQSVILTDGERMIKTPTWFVFYLYQAHQDAELLDSTLETAMVGPEGHQAPNMTESVSMGKDGKMHITLTNESVSEDYPIDVILDSGKAAAVEGMILTGEMHEHNTFDNPDQVKCTSFDDVKLTDDGLKLTLPKCSVLHLTVTVE